MNKKNTGMIATVATTLLCGCCALFSCIMGLGAITGNGSFTLGDSTQPMPTSYGYAFLCLSFLMILVPAGVAFFTMRKKPTVDVPLDIPQDLPPVS